MYRRYCDDSCRNYNYGYPNYGRVGSTNYNRSSNRRYNDGSVDSSPYWNEYYYGPRRRTPYAWERDREIGDNLRRSRSRRSAGTEDVILAPRTADRVESQPAPKDQPAPKEEPTPAPLPPKPEPPKQVEPTPPPPPPKPEPPKEELVKVLHVKAIEPHIEDNTKKHRTLAYVCTSKRKVEDKELPAELVLRRGDTFKLTITFDRPYEKEKHDLMLTASIGEHPTPSRGTQAQFKVDEENSSFKPDAWGAFLQDRKENDATLLVHIPVNCIVGEWNFSVKTFSEGKDEEGKAKTLIFQYEYEADITILFNPWCKDDGVYMETEQLLDEYVLNASGCVYRGNAWQIGAKEWNFGQFEEEILEISLYIMRSGFKGGMSKAMSDPVKVSRMIAKMVNSSDDNGVLVGNWSGKYDDGVSPSKWAGSTKILKQWKRDGPVRYGQCWVFSCVTTTVCRALGIPCRSVTNFASAHDTEESNSIEKYFVKKGKTYEKIDVPWSSDSIWNFHVWNEVWLKRHDLEEKGYDGWQVIDATPQEASDGVYTCGPCPVAAVKKGICTIPFDTAFVFAEVNADEVHWELLPGGDAKRIKLLKNTTGKFISTKVPDGLPYKEVTWGGYDRDSYAEKKRLDITHEYKFEENSEEERNAVMMAHKTARRPIAGTYDDMKAVEPIEFHLNHDNNVMIGGDLQIDFTATNGGVADRVISLIQIKVSPKSYTGETGKAFFEKKFDATKIKVGEEKSFKVILKPEDYLKNLIELANIYIEATAVVDKVDEDKDQITTKAHDVRFRRPDLEVQCPDKGKFGEKVKFVVSFTNPLNMPLTKCDISMDSDGFDDLDDIPQPDVPAKGEFKQEFELLVNTIAEKDHAVVFSFDCAELKDIAGSGSIRIEK